MTQRAMLCPRCRRWIGSDESSCSWCGTARTAAWWRVIARTRDTLAGDWLVKSIITVNIAFYLLSLLFSARGGLSGNPFSMLSPDQTSLRMLGATGTRPVEHYGF